MPTLRRTPADVASGWCWRNVLSRHEDVFVVRDETGPIVAWSSTAARPRALAGQSWYRGDLMEVRGDRRAAGWGAVVLLGICARAAELNATGGVVFLAAPGSEHFWAKYAIEGAPGGWGLPVEGLPMHVPWDTVQRLARRFHEARAHP